MVHAEQGPRHPEVFDLMDTDKNGFLSRNEIFQFVHDELEKQGEMNKITTDEENEMISQILEMEGTWLIKKTFRFSTLSLRLGDKLGCVVRMVVDSILPHVESGPNDHRKDAPQFSSQYAIEKSLKKTKTKMELFQGLNLLVLHIQNFDLIKIQNYYYFLLYFVF